MTNKAIDNSGEKNMLKLMTHSNSKLKFWATILNVTCSLGLASISILLSFPGRREWTIEHKWIFLLISICVFLGTVGIVLHFISYWNIRKFENNYIYYAESKKISTALLVALKRTDFDKTTAILQSTYGHVYEFHPMDYCKNILIYDIHQHLRTICIRMKEMIISLAPNKFNDDMVTVDITYRYPSDQCFKQYPIDGMRCDIEKLQTISLGSSAEWRIITSGDHTSSGNSIQSFLLPDQTTFYNYLDEKKYHFGNDKRDLANENHYSWSKKDEEYGRTGSIIGKVILLKNDTPETPFVEVYLTITTYGYKLVEENDPLSVEEYEKLFKETVINSYKTLIETELAQMFIRHGIRDHFIDRSTGRIIYRS